jgi:hypothetical protein
MRSLQYDLGKRSPLFFSFTGGVNLSGFSPTVFSNPATAPVTLTSSAAAPIDNTPAAFFTSSVNNPNTAYSFDNSVSLQPLTADSANSANLAWGALGADGNILGKPKSVYDQVSERNAIEAAAKEAAAKNAKLQEGNMRNWLQALLEIFQVIGGSMAAAPSTNSAPAAPAPAAG